MGLCTSIRLGGTNPSARRGLGATPPLIAQEVSTHQLIQHQRRAAWMSSVKASSAHSCWACTQLFPSPS